MSGEACRHYQLYEHDFNLAQFWGHKVVSWDNRSPHLGLFMRHFSDFLGLVIEHFISLALCLRVSGMR